ncbi:hypothetical protein G8759_25165 [Spirosoma aureum]|uniref:Uncharacterized protein n=1 Tax=Spirosoma aureum TaxID=2692134 RepID=A0A6G9AT74_9BACT|nr:hypothetical protein [Spirosoma aureum]QIP15687.1 hypothetical protein G8759_25165 [Spirosoma aureum]
MEYRIKAYFRQGSTNAGELTFRGHFNELAYTFGNKDELEKLGLIVEGIEKYTPVANHDHMRERGYTPEDTPKFFQAYESIDIPAWINFYTKVKSSLRTYEGKLANFYNQDSRDFSTALIDEMLAVFQMAESNRYDIVCTMVVS